MTLGRLAFRYTSRQSTVGVKALLARTQHDASSRRQVQYYSGGLARG